MNEQAEEFEQQSLTQHLADLRHSLIGILIAVGIGFAVSYSFVQPLGDWLLEPLRKVLPEHSSLIFTSYQEGFFFT